MSVFGLAKSQPAKPAQKGHVLVWPPEHFTVVYTLCFRFNHTANFLKTGFQVLAILPLIQIEDKYPRMKKVEINWAEPEKLRKLERSNTK